MEILYTQSTHTQSFQVAEWKKKHLYAVTESSERIHPELNMEQQVLLKKKLYNCQLQFTTSEELQLAAVTVAIWILQFLRPQAEKSGDVQELQKNQILTEIF